MATRLDHFVVEPITPNSLLFWDTNNNICDVGQFLDMGLQTVNEQSAVYQCVFKKSFSTSSTGAQEVLYYLINIVEYDALFGVGRGGGGQTGIIKEARFSDASNTSINVITGINFTISQGGTSLLITYTADTITLYNRQVLVPSN